MVAIAVKELGVDPLQTEAFAVPELRLALKENRDQPAEEML